MAITKFHPFNDLTSLNQRLNQLIQDSWGPNFPKAEDDIARGSWVPAVDIQEEGDSFIIHAELPGLKREDIQIRVEDRLLTISGERKFENEEKKDNFHRIERSYGRFTRSFTLNKKVAVESISANYKDGVLTVRVPKAPETQPRQIDINVE